MTTTNPYVIIRTARAGVFSGTLIANDGLQATLENARRLWYWEGAATLSELATLGTSKPTKCKFPMPVAKIQLTEVIEIISTTKRAEESIEAVPTWTSH